MKDYLPNIVICWNWCYRLYLILMVKEIHFYDTKPTLGNIFISIFTAVMMLVMIIIVYILLSEVINLFLDIIKEVTNRA